MDNPLQKYKAFVYSVRYGSFTKAAEIMSYTQSGVSRMVGDLEREWGIRLLERGKSGVHLTADGETIYPFALALLHDMESLQGTVDGIHGLMTGTVRIGTISSIATYRLPDILATMREDFPNLEFELRLGHYTEIEEWISDGSVDVGFLRLPTRHSFETQVLEEDRLLAVLPEEHPYAQADRLPLTALEEDPFILLEKKDKEEISAIFTEHGLTPEIRFQTVDDYAVMAMVEKGMGISILPELILKRAPFRIVTKELENPAHRTLGMAWRRDKRLSVAATRFLECVTTDYHADPTDRSL